MLIWITLRVSQPWTDLAVNNNLAKKWLCCRYKMKELDAANLDVRLRGCFRFILGFLHNTLSIKNVKYCRDMLQGKN